MIADWLTYWQSHVDKNFTEKKERTGLPVEHQRVFAAPTQTASHRKFGFKHRGRIGEHAVPQRPHLFLQLMRQLLQALAHDLVVVAASGVNGNHSFIGLLQAREFMLNQAMCIKLESAAVFIVRCTRMKGRRHVFRCG